jgi:hypothetical protein
LLGDKEPNGGSSNSNSAAADSTADGTAAAAEGGGGSDVPADFDVRVNVRLGGSMYYV